MDLTPSCILEEDAYHFHRILKRMCDIDDNTYYPKFKSWCDEYFRNKHRDQARGTSSIFFDDLRSDTEERMINILSFPSKLRRFVPACLYSHHREKE